MIKHVVFLVFTFPLYLFGQLNYEDSIGMEYFKKMCAEFEDARNVVIEASNAVDAIYDDGNSLRYHNVVNLFYERNEQLTVSTEGDFGNFQYIINKQHLIVNNIKTGDSESYQAYDNILNTVEYYKTKNEMLFPLGDFLYGDIKTKWLTDDVVVSYVGESVIDGKVTKHLAFFTDHTSWEIWLNPYHKFLPERMVIRSKDIEGNPCYTINFTNISLQ